MLYKNLGLRRREGEVRNQEVWKFVIGVLALAALSYIAFFVRGIL